MSATTDSGRRGLALMERLLNSLTDPARRERSVAAALLCYVALWTLYGILAKASQDIHVDMSEQFALARELALGYPKHPPLTMAVVRAWFAVFPAADWAYYLLAMANVGLTLWIVWRLMARFVDGEKRVVGLALLTLVPFFNFHALKFNVNTVLMPLWAATTLWFLRSFETRRPLDAALAGLAAAASMYGKYWSVFLLIGLGLAALADPRRAAYFRSAAPWVTVAVGALALAPHAAWLVANDFAPFSYAVVVHGASSLVSTLGAVGGYLAGSVGYVAIPLIIVYFAARPVGATVRNMAWPAQPQRRLAALAFWAVLLTPALVAPFTGVRLTSLWTMSAWTLLPVMLLSSPLVMISRRDALGILDSGRRLSGRDGRRRPGDRLCHPQLRAAARHGAVLATGRAGRAGVARDNQSTVAAVRRLRGIHRRRALLHAEPTIRGACARRGRGFPSAGGAHRARRHRAGLSDALPGAPDHRPVYRPRGRAGALLAARHAGRSRGIPASPRRRGQASALSCHHHSADAGGQAPPAAGPRYGLPGAALQNGMTAALSNVTAFCSVERPCAWVRSKSA